MSGDKLRSLTDAWRQATASVCAALLDDLRDRVVLWGWPDDGDRYDSWRAERDAEAAADEVYLFAMTEEF